VEQTTLHLSATLINNSKDRVINQSKKRNQQQSGPKYSRTGADNFKQGRWTFTGAEWRNFSQTTSNYKACIVNTKPDTRCSHSLLIFGDTCCRKVHKTTNLLKNNKWHDLHLDRSKQSVSKNHTNCIGSRSIALWWCNWYAKLFYVCKAVHSAWETAIWRLSEQTLQAII